MKNIASILFVVCILNSLSCSENDFKETSDLGDMRILAMVADKPEVNPASISTVTITPYISYLGFSGSLTYSAESCMDPGVGLGAEASCTNSATRTVIATNQAITQPVVGDGFTGAANSITVTLPSSAVAFGGRSTEAQYNGITVLVVYQLTASNGQVLKAFKRIVLSTKSNSDWDVNPVSVAPYTYTTLSNGSNLTSLPLNGTYLLKIPTLSPGVQTYPLYVNGSLTTRSEELLTSWYISDGDVKYLRTLGTDTTEFVAPTAAPSGRKAFIISVTRDGRGGEAVGFQSF